MGGPLQAARLTAAAKRTTCKERRLTRNRGDALDSGEIEIRYVRSAANPANQLTAPEVADRLARTIDAMSGRPPEGPPLDIEQDA